MSVFGTVGRGCAARRAAALGLVLLSAGCQPGGRSDAAESRHTAAAGDPTPAAEQPAAPEVPATSGGDGESLAEAVAALTAAGLSPPAADAPLEKWAALPVEAVPHLVAKVWKKGAPPRLIDPTLRDRSSARAAEVAFAVARTPAKGKDLGSMRAGVAAAVVAAWVAAEGRGDKDAVSGLFYFLGRAGAEKPEDVEFSKALVRAAAAAPEKVRAAPTRALALGCLLAFDRLAREVTLEVAKFEQQLVPPPGYGEAMARADLLPFGYGKVMAPFGAEGLALVKGMRDEWEAKAKDLKEKGDREGAGLCRDIASRYGLLLSYTSVYVKDK